jgi:hypothetical protein
MICMTVYLAVRKDHSTFWKTGTAKFAYNATFPDVIGGSRDSKIIANKFAAMFDSGCTHNSDVANDRLFDEFISCYNMPVQSLNRPLRTCAGTTRS